MQVEIINKQKLLDENGNIKNPGFSKKMYQIYDRNDIKAPKWRIKEWDYYYIGNNDYGLCLTISDAGYVSSLQVSVLDFNEPFHLDDSTLGLFPLGKLNLPNSSIKGDANASVGNLEMSFLNDGNTRHLIGTFKNYNKSDSDLIFDIKLSGIPEESMVIATPFNKDKHFYFNQKINCMYAEGYFEFNNKRYLFNKENGSLATLDWGRGVWTYDNTWYWGSGQMILENQKRFGFNLGYCFGDTSKASENMLFYEGKAHKLEDVTFNIPKNKNNEYEYLKKWNITSSDGRFEMEFEPIIDRNAPIDLKIVAMMPHQVFGKINGKAFLDDKSVIEIKDHVVFFERVHNKW